MIHEHGGAAGLLRPAVTFLGSVGSSFTGFAGIGEIYKSTDGGFSWYKTRGYGSEEFCFSSNFHGWAGHSLSVTYDGGESWDTVPGAQQGEYYGLHFDRTDNILAATGYVSIISFDGGITWQSLNPQFLKGADGGLAFTDDRNGIYETGDNDPSSTLTVRTTDGGRTWTSKQVYGRALQILPIVGTSTYFKIDPYGLVTRSNDGGDSWTAISTFSEFGDCFQGQSIQYNVNNSATIAGSIDSLFVVLCSGCYLSVDQGYHWKFLCGVQSQLQAFQKFYADAHRVFMFAHDSNNDANLWMLNLDSMQYFHPSLSVDGAKDVQLAAASREVEIHLISDQSSIALDSGKVRLRFDSRSLSFKNLILPAGWTIIDSSSGDGFLDLHFKADSTLDIGSPLLFAVFNTFLDSSGSAAKVYLDTCLMFGKRLNCDCPAIAAQAKDSVTIHFSGCGDSILEAVMQGRPFDVLSIRPNPVRSVLTAEIQDNQKLGVHYELVDALGASRGEGDISSGESVIPTGSLPSGAYFLRLSEAGYVVTRRVVISH